MIKRECDLNQVHLMEIVKKHKPQNILTTEFSEELVSKFFIIEEGETEITGNLREWMLFISRIIDLYENEKKTNERVDFSLEGLVPNSSDNGNLMNQFLETYLLKNKVKLPETFTISGNIFQFERLFRILQGLENSSTFNKDL